MTTPTRILVRAPLVPAEGLIFFYGHAHRLIAALPSASHCERDGHDAEGYAALRCSRRPSTLHSTKRHAALMPSDRASL